MSCPRRLPAASLPRGKEQEGERDGDQERERESKREREREREGQMVRESEGRVRSLYQIERAWLLVGGRIVLDVAFPPSAGSCASQSEVLCTGRCIALS